MNSHLLKLLLFSGIVSGFSSCDGDAVVVNSQGENQITIHGFISDEEGQSVEGASIQLGTYKTTSNSEGHFELPKVRCVPEVYIQVNKQGYFTGSRMLNLETSKSAYVRVSLIQKKFANTFQSSTGASLDIEGKVKLVFPPQAIADQYGSTYNGNVQLAVKYLDPTSSLTGEMMPGNLIGLDANGELRALGSYAMAAIQLQSSSGETLKIKNGKEVLITFEIPNSLRSSAPASIPLWYFDEAKGIWKEEGSAIKSGNYYEGNVKHFSFWNCDYPYPSIKLKGRLTSVNGSPMDNVIIKLTIIGSNVSSSAATNNEGLFEGRVPKDELFKMEIFHNCSALLFVQDIGPFNVDTDLKDLVVATDINSTTHISATVQDLEQKPIAWAPVTVKSIFGNLIAKCETDEKGEFTTFSRTLCAFDSVRVFVNDLCGQQVYSRSFEIVNSKGNLGVLPLTDGIFKLIPIHGIVIDAKNDPLPNTIIQLSSGARTYKITSDQDGAFHKLIPACGIDQWALSVFDRCNNQIFVSNISLNTAEGELGSIRVPSGAFELIPVEGKVIDCRNIGLGNIALTIKSGEHTYQTKSNSDGSYNLNVPFCDQNSITITAYDPFNYVYSNSVTYQLPGPIHVLPLQICKENTTEYLNVQFSDGTTITEKYNLEVEDIFGELHIFTNTKDPWFELKWEGAGSVSKVTPISEITYFKSNSQYIAKYYNQDNAYILFANVARSTGEYYQGVFEGIDIKKIDISTGKELAAKIKASGSFKIKRGW